MDLKRWKIFQKLDPVFAADVRRAYLTGIDSDSDAWKEDGPLPYGGGAMVMRNGDFYTIVLTSDVPELLGQETCQGLLPLVPLKCEEMCGQTIRDIRSGFEHVAALTAEGLVYQWGVICKVVKPSVVSGPLNSQKVIQIACGESHTLALTHEGEVYSWGENLCGQLGNGNRTDQMDPVKVSGLNGFDKKIISVECGGWTSFALDHEGNVWSWGDHEDRALGYPSPSSQLYPKKVSVSNIRKIAAGNAHVLALSTANRLYFWGRHTSEDPVITPIKIETKGVVDIGAVRGCAVSALKTSDGKVLFWGYAYGRLNSDPVATKFNSMEELFASLDTPMMLKPVEFEHTELTLVEKLKQSFDDKESGDIRFIVQGQTIYAHRAVLKIRSDYLRRMFETTWKESVEKEGVLQISTFSYVGFRTFLLYLYTDRMEPPPRYSKTVIELIKIADKYGEQGLKQRCEQQLKLVTTKHTVCDLYSIAVGYNNKSLHDHAMDLIIPNLNVVLRSDGYMNMPDVLKNRLIQELAAEELFVGLKRKRKE